jgi:PERQ amino acid-rich with GYF domain-containing protein
MSGSSGQSSLPFRETGLPSPRNRVGFGPSFDGVLNGAESWTARRRATEGLPKLEAALSPQGTREEGERLDGKAEIKEEDEQHERPGAARDDSSAVPPSHQNHSSDIPAVGVQAAERNPGVSSVTSRAAPETSNHLNMDLTWRPSPGVPDLASVEWSYLDPQGQVQGQDSSFYFILILLKLYVTMIRTIPSGCHAKVVRRGLLQP